MDCCRFLLEHNANVNAQSNSKKTPLHQAVINSNTQVISLLLSHPLTDATLKDSDGLTPFDIAKKSGNSELLDYFQVESRQKLGNMEKISRI